MDIKYCVECGERNDASEGRCTRCGFAFEGIQEAPDSRTAVIREPEPERPLWYYTYQGAAQGPADETVVFRLCASGVLSRETLVWTKGMANWAPIAGTEPFAHAFAAPPPLTGSAAPNGLAWWLAFSPILALLFFSLSPYLLLLWYVPFGLVLGLALSDRQRLRQLGHPKIAFGWALVFPVYLFIRATRLKQRYFYPVMCCVSIIIAITGAAYVQVPPASTDRQLIEIVRSGYLDEHPERTIGEAFESFVDEPEWDGFQGTDGNKYVNLTGDIIYGRSEVTLLLQFRVDADTGRTRVNALLLNDRPQDGETIRSLLSAVFGGDSRSIGGDTKAA